MNALQRSHRHLGGAVLTLLLCLTVASCGNKNKRPNGDLVTDKDPVRGFLATIPADTPYAFVAVEPMPLAPMLSWMDGWSKSMQDVTGNLDQLLADEYVDPETKAMIALLSEFEGNYNAEGFKKLGLSMSPRFAVYGIGFLPAVRMDLDDPVAFKELVARVESRSGMKSTQETVGKTDFWSYQFGRDFVVMSVVNRQLVFGWTAPETAELYTAYLIGEKLPEKSMADDDRVSPVAKTYGFQAYGAGYIDFERIAQIVLEPKAGLNDEIFKLLESDGPEPVSPECITETKRLLAAAPRMVFGYEGWSATQAKFGMGIELRNDLGKRILAAKTNPPLAGTEIVSQAPASLLFGFDLGKMMEILNAEMLAVRDTPYQCEWYGELNQLATEGAMFAGMVPAMVTNLRGGTVVLKSMRRVTAPPAAPPSGGLDQDQFGDAPDVKFEGVAAISSVDPSGLLAWLRTLAPEFANVTPDPAGTPMALPSSQSLATLDAPFIVLTKKELAITSGEGLADEVSRALTGTPADGPFFSFRYDLPAIAAMFAESGAPLPMLDGFIFGQMGIEIEPRADALFMHADMTFPARTTR